MTQSQPKVTYIITEQHDGKFYGRIPDSDDGHGNEMDAMWPTPEETLKCLKEQWEEQGVWCPYCGKFGCEN